MSKLTEIRDEFCGKKQTRTFSVDRGAVIDEDERTIEVAYASGDPILHWFGYLSLNINADSVRTDRLDSGAAYLLDHDREKQIGVIDSYSFGEDGMARAVLRFSKSSLGEEIFQDVKDGIRRNISVGFVVHEIEKDMELSQEGEDPYYRSGDWEVLEISTVSIPADVSVGVGRSADDVKNVDDPWWGTITYTDPPAKLFLGTSTSTPDLQPLTIEPETNMSDKTKTVRDEPSEVEILTERVKEYVDFAKQFGDYEEVARDIALDDSKDFADLRTAIQAKRETVSVKTPVKDPKDSARDSGIQLAKSVYRHSKLKSFPNTDEGRRDAYRTGRWLQAALMNDPDAQQYCRDNGLLMRTQTGEDNSKGGYLVPEEFENVMIDLRILYGVFRNNANVVPMASDTKSRPRRAGGLTAYWVGAGDTITESNATWDRVGLVAKKLAALAKWENEFGEDASIDAADTLASEIAYAFSQSEDEAGFSGTGLSATGGITGIRQSLLNVDGTIGNIAGLQVASGNAYSEIVLADFRGVLGRLPQFARRVGMNKWYCSNQFYENVMTKLADAVGGVTRREIEGGSMEVFLGYPVEITEVMPTAEANSQVCCVFGNLSMAAMMGDRRGIQIAQTDSHASDFAADVMTIKGTERVDINVHDVGDTTIGGPMVGLITAAS